MSTTISPPDPMWRVVRRPLPWQREGLRQTASGYGARLTTELVLLAPNGRYRRVYVTRWANAGSCWVRYKQRGKVFLPDTTEEGDCFVFSGTCVFRAFV